MKEALAVIDAPEPEVEITPEMISAGVSELASWALDDSHVSADCISAVYAAMERSRTSMASPIRPSRRSRNKR